MTLIEPKLNWEIPRGTYTATLESIHNKTRTHKGATISQIRLLFRIDALSDEYVTAMVGKSFDIDPSPGSELRNFLDGWLGAAAVESSRQGNRLDLEGLREKQVDLVIRHKNPGNSQSHT